MKTGAVNVYDISENPVIQNCQLIRSYSIRRVYDNCAMFRELQKKILYDWPIIARPYLGRTWCFFKRTGLTGQRLRAESIWNQQCLG